jgi:hypothetical protein
VALIVQVAGVLAVSALVAGLLRPDRPFSPSTAGVVALLVVATAFSFWSDVWGSGRAFVLSRSADAPAAAPGIDPSGGSHLDAREDFLAWVERRVPPDAAVALDCRDPRCPEGLYEWITYRLTPRRFPADRRQAGWIVYYGVPPDARRRDGANLELLPFEENLALARRRG